MFNRTRAVPVLAALVLFHQPAHAPQTLLLAPDRWAQLGDATLRYRVIGQGKPMILLHGYTDRLEMWRGAADSLAQSYQVIVPDLRGFGSSTKFSDPVRYPHGMVDDVARLLDLLGHAQAHIVGYSMGAMVGSQLAIRHPDRVASLTLVGAPIFPDSASSARMWEPLAEQTERGGGVGGLMNWMFPAWSDSAIDRLNRDVMASNDLGSLVASVRAFAAFAIPSSTPVPGRHRTLAIVGTADPLLEQSRALVRWWPGARLVEVPGADHASILDHPALVSEIRSVAAGGSRVPGIRRRPGRGALRSEK